MHGSRDRQPNLAPDCVTPAAESESVGTAILPAEYERRRAMRAVPGGCQLALPRRAAVCTEHPLWYGPSAQR